MADFLEIRGGVPLKGSVKVSGAKNGALPMLIAALLSSEPIKFSNVPHLEDITVLYQLLEQLGAVVVPNGRDVEISTPSLIASETSYSLVKALRASFWVLAPLLARGGAARVALPGGDNIGARPVDIHLEALEKMGANISVKHGVVLASAPKGLKPCEIEFRFPSVGATHQILMAAALIPGTTVLRGAAREPEVVALAQMLTTMGATIEGAGNSTIIIQGREQLGGGTVQILGDRVEAATYALAAGITGGDIIIEGFDPSHFGSFTDVLQQIGVQLESGTQGLRAKAPDGLSATRVTTAPFPGFATDIQAPLMAALCVANGESRIEETMFEGRFRHVSELARLGADIQIEDRVACIRGPRKLSGALVEAFDIRAGAALVVAGLAADGVTNVAEPHHIRRGYDSFVQKLAGLGARIAVGSADLEELLQVGC